MHHEWMYSQWSVKKLAAAGMGEGGGLAKFGLYYSQLFRKKTQQRNQKQLDEIIGTT